MTAIGKKWGILLLCFLALFVLPPKAAAADSGTCGEHLTWEVKDGTLTIRGTGDMNNFEAGGCPWAESSFTVVVIEPGAASIGNCAFILRRHLTSVTIPDSVTRIGDAAFAWCNSLNDVTIPNKVTSIGRQAFQGCDAMKRLSIPNSVETIKWHAFLGCAGLTEVSIPASVTKIEDGAFGDLDSLPRFNVSQENPNYDTLDGVLMNKQNSRIIAFPGGRGGSYVIPDSVTWIETEAFRGCKKLTEISIPGSVNGLGSNAFSGCDGLTSVSIPASLEHINYGAFSGCNSLKEIRVSDGNSAYKSIDGVLFTKDQKTLLCYPGDYGESYIVPKDVNVIMEYAFTGCRKLTDVTMLDGVTTIGGAQFDGCNNLRRLTLPRTISRIGYNILPFSYKFTDIYYNGNQAQWDAIEVNGDLIRETFSNTVTIHYQFNDVPTTAYYADAVSWAVSTGITNGTSDTTFTPNNTCTTGNIITFLWRANGSPEPGGPNPFSDVADQYYAKAAVWAYENGLVSGETFNAASPCTRAAVMKYLWILSGCPSTSASSFTDVPASADYAQAVSWAVARGVTNGTSASTFAPDNTCTRGQIVTFLLRNAMG